VNLTDGGFAERPENAGDVEFRGRGFRTGRHTIPFNDKCQ
jgi:hypothetical protein